MPDFTTASAMLLIMSSLTLQANLFHEFQPMGGVSARLAEGDDFSCAVATESNSEMNTQKAAANAVFFMRLFYQNQSEDGKEMRKEWVILGLSNPGESCCCCGERQRRGLQFLFLPIFKGASTWPRSVLTHG